LLNYLSFTLTSFFGLFRARPSDYVFVESPPLFLAIPGFFISRLRGALFIFNVSDLWPDSLRDMGVVEGKKVVLYQGSEGYAHNLENVLHAAKLLESDGIHFLFVGDGSVRRHLEKLKQELQLNNLTFLDPVPKEDLPRFFSIADCGLVSLGETALFEGARPAKIWPIMSSGKPLLYVGKGEGAELVFEAKAGIVVPPGNHPEALAASTRALLNDPTLAAVLGRNGRAYVEKHMRWSSLIEHWLAALTNASVDIGEVSLNVSCRHT
jgi:glycosyltransferase involved in cell wall biosynthesis